VAQVLRPLHRELGGNNDTKCLYSLTAALRVPSLAAVVVLPAARGALDERRLVGTVASGLNTLAGARGGHGGCHPANTKTRSQAPASRRHDAWGSARLPQGGKSSLPLPWGLSGRRDCGRRGQRRTPSHLRSARQRLCGACRLSRGPPGGGCSRARPRRCLLCRLRDSRRGGGAGSHLSGRAHPPSLPSSSSDDEYSEVAGEESPFCSRSWNSSLLCSQRSQRRILFSSLRAARSCSRRCAAHARARAWGMGGSDRVAFTVTHCRE
jgi:hypothetical protein